MQDTKQKEQKEQKDQGKQKKQKKQMAQGTEQKKKQGNAKGRYRFQNVLFRWRGKKVHRQIKDRLFRTLFEKDREALLQLYNALNGTDYQDAGKLQVVTIESAVYMVMKNDLAFVVAGTLNLYEHQSTWNPNMPVRFLIYLAEEYQMLAEEAKESLYGTKLIQLPTPQCVVFYNGERNAPEEQILRLSDAFENRRSEASVELTVRMLNINYGHNKELMEKCRVLGEYSQFVDICRQYAAEGGDIQEALETAIEYCIDHGILSKFLRNNQAEVLGMLLERFDVKKYERSLREDERDRMNKLNAALLAQDRIADLKRATEDSAFQEQLFREFEL
ncbi:MAG: hypothetical protein NC417_04295 [Candidatus Gastranaerophilales bacterium]|nr:hypothetical protein [Candidatus Gastranaerophilales bacterium]